MNIEHFFDGFVKEGRALGLSDTQIKQVYAVAQELPAMLKSAQAKLLPPGAANAVAKGGKGGLLRALAAMLGVTGAAAAGTYMANYKTPAQRDKQARLRTPAQRDEQARLRMINNALNMQRAVTNHRLDTNFMRNMDNYARGIDSRAYPARSYYA